VFLAPDEAGSAEHAQSIMIVMSPQKMHLYGMASFPVLKLRAFREPRLIRGGFIFI
jgi:hypothetical protein